MKYKIIVDTGGELTADMKKQESFVFAPLSIDIDGTVIVDETISQQDLLDRIAASPNCPKSSCPSPEAFLELYNCEAEHVYVVTMSGALSGTYNSALLGKNLFEEENDTKKIHVFDSVSASVGETNICNLIQKYEEQGMEFEKIVEEINQFIASQKIYFVLESLDTLRKNGRLTGIKSVLASALNIKPVMSADKTGVITQLGQARGMKKALAKMVETMIDDVPDIENRVIGIAHCNNYARAELVKKMIEEKVSAKEIYITETSGISTMYASDGGIVMAV